MGRGGWGRGSEALTGSGCYQRWPSLTKTFTSSIVTPGTGTTCVPSAQCVPASACARVGWLQWCMRLRVGRRDDPARATHVLDPDTDIGAAGLGRGPCRQAEVAEWRQDKRITIRGNGVPKPILTFREANFPGYVMDVLDSETFDRPTAIQAQVRRPAWQHAKRPWPTGHTRAPGGCGGSMYALADQDPDLLLASWR